MGNWELIIFHFCSSNVYAITADQPAGQNIACVNDFKTNILAPNNVNIPSDVNTFCAPYNIDVFPNIETTLQGKPDVLATQIRMSNVVLLMEKRICLLVVKGSMLLANGALV